MADLSALKPRIRVPARSALLNTTAITSIQFRGIGANKPAADDSDEMDGDDDDDSMATEKPAPKEKPKTKTKKKAKKTAKSDDDDDGGDDDGSNEDDDPDGDGDDDDDDEETDRREVRANNPARAPRMRERARIAAILELPAAKANVDFAVQVALTTDLTRRQAIKLLESAPRASGGTKLGSRMADYGNLRPGTGASAAPKGQAAIDLLWDQQAIANGIVQRRR